MWTDFMKRWLNLWFWWLPRERQEAERESAEPAPPASDEPSERADATTSSVTTPPASHEPPVASDPVAEPETAPEPQTAAESPASGEPAPAPRTEPDNLTELKGIGPAVQEKLHALGIATYTDLAKADADWLTRELKSQQVVVSLARVQQWITAARNRV
ncbi:MAG: hypothetical protein JJT90_14265 [Ectothiorhodospiraceae bacterium]|nr:hypothetical protein [Ectothiorhodospiraceae bacterium]